MNRRGFIAGAATAPLAAGALASTVEIRSLIDGHAAAAQAYGDAVSRHEVCVATYRKAHGSPDIARSFLGGGYGMDMGRKHCLHHVSAGYDTRRKALVYVERLSPDLAGQLRVLLDIREAENIAAVHRQFDEEEARKEAFGLNPLRRLVDETSEAEEAAALALCSHRCTSIDDVRARASYLRTAEILSDGLTDEQMAALIASGAV